MKLQIISALFTLTVGIMTTSHAQQDLGLERQLLVKTSPLAFLEPETIVLQGGLEYFFSNKISIQSEIGVNGGIFGIKADRGKNEDFKLWRTKNELKFYTKKNYWALEFFFVNKDFTRTDDKYNHTGQTIYYDQAKIQFRVFGSGVKFGRQVYTSENILIDSFGGLGFRGRYRQIRQVELAENQSGEFLENFFGFGDRYRFDGWDSVPHLTIGIKVGILPGK
ncbi:DUF3575 domain-containing protein [Algoriphagus algorifonticola]|uniref:DUF3575 domain-containing protein n=1 Tax=Algoriphagus algorifonticola TaxID=2593007 RepID=UPI0011A7A865|nr:DUF3575 domain-containing protein [Algoriphagus algorifonticola]